MNLTSLFGLPTRRRAPRVKEWHVHMVNPVTGVIAWTAIERRKCDALAEAAWNIRPDRAPRIEPRY
jgi:hypothetical protein